MFVSDKGAEASIKDLYNTELASPRAKATPATLHPKRRCPAGTFGTAYGADSDDACSGCGPGNFSGEGWTFCAPCLQIILI